MDTTEHHAKHVPQWKRDEVEEIKQLVASHPVIGVVGMRGIPSKQLQQMREELEGTALLRMTRNSLIDRAFDEAGLEELKEYIHDQTALIFTEQNPFRLYRKLEESKTPAPIKGGAQAPRDIVVEKGPTSFPPGPIVGDLQQAGIPAAIEGGKVVIRETRTVAKEGETVSRRLAEMLTRLEIYPMEVGLDLRAAFEDGTVFEPSTLAIDIAEYRNNFISAAQSAMNLSVNTAYPTPDTMKVLLASAQMESLALAVGATLYTPEAMQQILARAQQQMLSLAGAASTTEGAVDEELTAMLAGAAAAAPAAAPAEEKAEEQKEEEEEEEEAEESGMEGLGALFG